MTSSGFLGNCVSASSCRIGGATSGRCPRSTVCCLRVSSTSGVPTQAPPARPAVVQPTLVRRRLCTYRGPVTSSSVGLLARSGRVRRSPQRSRPRNCDRCFTEIRNGRPQRVCAFVAGCEVTGANAHAVGLIGRQTSVSLDSVLSQIRRPTQYKTVVTLC